MPFLCKKFLMSSLLDDLSVVNHQDDVRVLYSGKSVSYDDGSPAFYDLIDSSLDLLLRDGID